MDHTVAFPELQVLQGRISSMFALYEALLAYSTPVSAPTIYFHTTRVSFTSDKAKRKWLSDANMSLNLPRWRMVPLRKADQLVEDSRYSDITQMEYADHYSDFIDGALASKQCIWTALFFTCNPLNSGHVWHEWAACIQYDLSATSCTIYTQFLDSSFPPECGPKRRFQRSQINLQRTCRARGWKTRRCVYRPGFSAIVDRALGWTRLWIGSLQC
jgi:hypothetical protein